MFKTVGGMDADVERIGTYSQRVLNIWGFFSSASVIYGERVSGFRVTCFTIKGKKVVYTCYNPSWIV